MCGIAGSIIFESSSHQQSPELISAMRDSMAHRGPDGVGLWIDATRKVALAHRRLSIIDLSSAADQPMSNASGSLRIVFNGEIYNHREIRAELERVGHFHWKTDHSDTEVILHAFEQWGIDCIHRFRGMFGFALWDERNRELWLVRDRIGIKPIYYSQFNGKLNFASEIKALLKDPDQKRAVDEQSLYHYLSFLTVPAPNTLFAGISKLRPGHWLKIDATGRITEKQYWDVWDHTTPLLKQSEGEIAEMLLAELKTAVALRKVSDVPVGVFLSGGIDSSTNAALFSQGDNQQVKTFSIGYKGEHASYPSELPYARQVAKLVNADHHEYEISESDLLDFLPRMIELQDEPIADPVCVPVYYVSKLARDNGVIVCQVGEGSDELFCGYPAWNRSLELQKMNDLPVPGFLKSLGLGVLSMAGKSNSFPYEWLRRGTRGLPVFWSGAEAFTESHKQRLLNSESKKRIGTGSSWDAIKPTYDLFQQKAWEKSRLNWMTYADLKLRLPELLLMRVDKMSMGVSLEGRVPFLDHKFVELAMSIPTSVKTRNGELKHILKKAVRGVIPDEIIDRKKQGFGVPIHEWFFEKLGVEARNSVRKICADTGYFNHEAVEGVLASHNSAQIWYLMNFALWWQHYITGGDNRARMAERA
jgi:asparagine synthase (glutamine-hydrolysing)